MSKRIMDAIKNKTLAACMFFTAIYGIFTFDAYVQRKKEWNEQAEKAFIEAVGKELRRTPEKDEYYNINASRYQNMTLDAEIPDSIVISSQGRNNVYRLPKYRRKNAYFKEGGKNAILTIIIAENLLNSDSVNNVWGRLLASHGINAKTGICSKITDLSGKVSTVCSSSFEKFTPADSLISTYMGYRLEMELSGYISYPWWNILPVRMIIIPIMLWCMCIIFVVYNERINVSRQKEMVIGKAIEETPSMRQLRRKSGHINKERIYKIGDNVYFDAVRKVFYNDEGITEKLSGNMSVLLENFLKAPNNALSRLDIYRIIGKEVDNYSLDNFYKMIERLRKKLEQVSSATLHNDGNGSYHLILPLSNVNRYETAGRTLVTN